MNVSRHTPVFSMPLLVLVFLCFACAGGKEGPVGSRTISYYSDQTLVVPQKISRIACGWNAQNSIIAMLGYGEQIVVTTDMIRKSPIFGRFVPSIKNAAVCVSSSGTLNVEELIKAKPDVVFLTENAGGQQLQQIRQMGMPVALLKANSIKNLVERAEITGRILGDDAHARALKYVEYYNNNVKRVGERVSRIPQKQRIRVYHTMGSPFMTAAAPSLVQDWMDLAGVINVAENWKLTSSSPGTASRNVDLEQIIAANPEVIVCMNSADAKTIRSGPAWKSIQAVKNGRVHVNPQGMFLWCRESTEEALQFLWLAKTVYPSLFQDVDMEKETRHFYETFYGYRLSDDDVHLFLNPI